MPQSVSDVVVVIILGVLVGHTHAPVSVIGFQEFTPVLVSLLKSL